MTKNTDHNIKAEYAALLLSAVTAVSLFACGSEPQESIIKPDPPVTYAPMTTEPVQTTAEPVTTARVTTTVTTAKSKPKNFGITINDVLALDVNKLCPDSRRRSGVCVLTDRYGETDSYLTTRYEFAIDDDLQAGWYFGRSVNEDGEVVAEDFDYEKSVYFIEGEGEYAKYDRETKTWSPMDEPVKSCAAYDHFAAYCYDVVPVQLMYDVFKQSASERNKNIFDDCKIVDVKESGGKKIVCLTQESIMDNEDMSRKYYWELDAETGLCLVYRLYDIHDTLLMEWLYEDIKFGDEAVPPLTQQEVKDLILENSYRTDMLGNHPYPIILDEEITLMPDVYKEALGEEKYNKIMESIQDVERTEN